MWNIWLNLNVRCEFADMKHVVISVSLSRKLQFWINSRYLCSNLHKLQFCCNFLYEMSKINSRLWFGPIVGVRCGRNWRHRSVQQRFRWKIDKNDAVDDQTIPKCFAANVELKVYLIKDYKLNSTTVFSSSHVQ